jgi:hypothetical protein
VLHFLEEPAQAINEAAAALAAGGRLLIADFAPHEHEELRDSQAHRRLGFSHAQMKKWIAAAGLRVEAAEDMAPKADAQGLTVTIWSALDRRAAHAGREAEAGQ